MPGTVLVSPVSALLKKKSSFSKFDIFVFSGISPWVIFAQNVLLAVNSKKTCVIVGTIPFKPENYLLDLQCHSQKKKKKNSALKNICSMFVAQKSAG